MPLNVVIQRVTEELLGSNAVVVIQLDRHCQPPLARSDNFGLALTIHLLGGTVKERDEFYVLGHRKQVKNLQLFHDKPAP